MTDNFYIFPLIDLIKIKDKIIENGLSEIIPGASNYMVEKIRGSSNQRLFGKIIEHNEHYRISEIKLIDHLNLSGIESRDNLGFKKIIARILKELSK
jgi:hypothetical protein